MRGIRLGFSLLLAIALFFFLLFSCLSFMVVDGPSMEPTFSSGQIVAVNRLAFGIRTPWGYLPRWAGPRVGQLLVFRNPLDGRVVFKRCLAVGGQVLERDGEGLSIGAISLPLDPAQSFHFMDDFTVPSDYVFVAGDNPAESVDSRDYGCMPIEKILGKVLVSP